MVESTLLHGGSLMALACFTTSSMLSQEPRVNIVLLLVAGQVGYGVKDVKEKGLHRK